MECFVSSEILSHPASPKGLRRGKRRHKDLRAQVHKSIRHKGTRQSAGPPDESAYGGQATSRSRGIFSRIEDS